MLSAIQQVWQFKAYAFHTVVEFGEHDGGAATFHIKIADMTVGGEIDNMVLDNMQEFPAVLDEERLRHRRDDVCPHYATLYVVSGLHFFWFKKRVS